MKVNIIQKAQEWNRRQGMSLDIRMIAHPMDGKIIRVLEQTGIKTPLNTVVEQAVSATYGPELATGVAIDAHNFPEIYGKLKECTDKLGIRMPYAVITNHMSGINAAALGTDQKPFIMISNVAPRLLNDQELKFIIAHECGHIAMEHMVYHSAVSMASVMGGFVPVIGPVLTKAAVLPLNYWNRCSEITADRVGLLCCGDLHTAQMALLKIVGGFTDVADIDINRYIAQSKATQDGQTLGKINEYFQAHPMIYKRLQALDLFARSETYEWITGKAVPAGERLSRTQLDEKVENLMKVL